MLHCVAPTWLLKVPFASGVDLSVLTDQDGCLLCLHLYKSASQRCAISDRFFDLEAFCSMLALEADDATVPPADGAAASLAEA